MCVQYRGGGGGGGAQYRGDIMINVGDILSTVGMFSTVGDIMSTVEGVQYGGGSLLLFEYPTVLNTQRYS